MNPISSMWAATITFRRCDPWLAATHQDVPQGIHLDAVGMRFYLFPNDFPDGSFITRDGAGIAQPLQQLVLRCPDVG